MHLQVERVVRETADRTYYLVNNARRRWYTVKCWECGNKHSPPSAQSCTYCSAPLGFRRLLMSARWDRGSVRAFQAYAHRRLKAHTLSQPVALYRYKDQLLAFFPWEGENLLVNEPAPLSRKEILLMAFQLGGEIIEQIEYLFSFFHDIGFGLKGELVG